MAERHSSSLRSPLGRVSGLGSAKDGTSHWWAQRLSAVALLPLTLWFVISLLALPDLSYATVHAWLARPLDAFLAALGVAVLARHSLLGTSVIVEDYVHGPAAKLLALVGLRFMHVLAGAAGIFALLRLTFGTP
ncbi:MAG: succinate dehydrogenase, hydrophobic membrane anchor protein [Gammaproteobacteria bacterium]|nr:succinate dehydrogenase, hydrophobic membrane anchor protein [Gammaproteobacteria bacterium]